MRSRKLLFISFFFFSLAKSLVGQGFQHLTVSSGFNQDVIANGPGPAVNSSTAGVDSTGIILANCLMANNFQPTAAPPPAYALPMSGIINSAVTAGLSYQLGSYTANNSLWLKGIASGTIAFSNQQMATKLYILTTSGHGASICSGIIHFTDNTVQNFGSFTVPDWFNSNTLPIAASNMGRVLRGTNAIENPAGNPRLYQYLVNILPQNFLKTIESIEFNKTNALAVLNIFAVTAELSPCPDLELFGADFELCPGADSTLTPDIANGVTYTWSNGSSEPVLNVTAPGTYWVNVQTSQCTYSDTVSVILPYLVQPFSLGNDVVLCPNETVTVSPNIIQAGDYLWSDGSTNLSMTASGEGLVWLQISDGCGSVRDSLYTSVLYEPVSFSLGPDISFCQGETRVLTAQVQPGMTYLWQNGSSESSLTISNPGTYWLRIFNDCGMVTDTLIATIPPTPVAVLPLDTTLCNNATLVLNPLLTNHTGLYWHDGSAGSTFTITHSGTYTVYAYNQCDTVSDAITATYINTPVVQVGTDLTPCEGETVTLTAYGNGNNYIWLDGSFGSNYTVTQSGIYWAMASNYCGITYDTLEVRYILRPRVDLGPDQELCDGGSIMLSVSNPRANYLWDDGSTEEYRLVYTAGEYFLRAYNQCGEASDSISVSYKDCSCVVYLPNAFTPDGDGLNDFFQPEFNCNFKEYSFRIFNAWGQMIFESHEPGFPWDGSSHAGDYYVQDGVYSYLLAYQAVEDIEPIVLKGSVIILR